MVFTQNNQEWYLSRVTKYSTNSSNPTSQTVTRFFTKQHQDLPQRDTERWLNCIWPHPQFNTKTKALKLRIGFSLTSVCAPGPNFCVKASKHPTVTHLYIQSTQVPLGKKLILWYWLWGARLRLPYATHSQDTLLVLLWTEQTSTLEKGHSEYLQTPNPLILTYFHTTENEIQADI